MKKLNQEERDGKMKLEHRQKFTNEDGTMEREQTTIRLPVDLKKKLQQEADKRGMGFNAYVLLCLNEERNRQE